MIAILARFVVNISLAVSNTYFMVGMLMIVASLCIIVFHGGLFTGWRIFHRKGDDVRSENEKIPYNKIGRVKNKPIRVGKLDTILLLFGMYLAILSVLITV
ncbi:DUF3899 domain-containing protein [Apilactobacillus xinyiensis]|uniref:DUF3899 domain-containing protein n=1 Tax=Apilactobacillus xinyiensis TaxID=2841032 RepID=UPI00200FF70C|nr:DUF3899 domain-containing protein [Apilactobacillus xinyiensis]MCL0330460.1 DUF3899 domain-containing protein [Apilactobacillus xinyiensis]